MRFCLRLSFRIRTFSLINPNGSHYLKKIISFFFALGNLRLLLIQEKKNHPSGFRKSSLAEQSDFDLGLYKWYIECNFFFLDKF